MEEALRDSLSVAGKQLAETIQKGLRVRGLPDSIEVEVDGLRVSVVSKSAEVYNAEHGTVDAPPTAPVEKIVRSAAEDLVRTFTRHLEASLHERGF